MEKLVITLNRNGSADYGTFGSIQHGKMQFATLELPWLNNERRVSCIPEGSYECAVVDSPRFGKVYGLQEVEGRSHILIHAGNTIKDIEGCILLGLYRGMLGNQPAVLQSKIAVNQFMRNMGGLPFTLNIVDSKY